MTRLGFILHVVMLLLFILFLMTVAFLFVGWPVALVTAVVIVVVWFLSSDKRGVREKLGFILDYIGRLITFILVMVTLPFLFADWRTGLATVALTAIAWLGSRSGRYLLAGHAIDPVLQLPLSWW